MGACLQGTETFMPHSILPTGNQKKLKKALQSQSVLLLQLFCHTFSVGFCINEEEVTAGPDDDWSIQSKRQQVIFQAQVGTR